MSGNTLYTHTYTHIRMHAYVHKWFCLLKHFCTSKRIIIYARYERRLRDKIVLNVCVRRYVSLNLIVQNEKCHNSDMRFLFLGIDCTNFIQTGRNRKLVFTLYNKSARFLITALVSEIF